MLRGRQSGFTLLEALVALVILATTFTAVWEWFGTSIQATRKIEHALAMPETVSQFLIHLDMESLQEDVQGTVNIGRYQVEWTAQPDRTNTQEQSRRQPAWVVTLFSVSASVYQDGQLIEKFETKVFRQWRDPAYVEFPPRLR